MLAFQILGTTGFFAILIAALIVLAVVYIIRRL